jgi:hypothetical protein
MKIQADKNRSERTFVVGDMVDLKLQPYVQSSVAPRSHHKLLFKYIDPYDVLERVGDVVYRLNFRETSHVSHVKKAIGANTQVQPVVPSPLDMF